MITALIPARGGSKRIPLKNARSLGGKPLIDWSIAFALESASISKTVISTDSEDIVASSIYLSDNLSSFQKANLNQMLSIGTNLYLHKRSKDTASDQARTFAVIEDLMLIPDFQIDKLLLLQPTSPFRSNDELLDLITIMENNKSESVFSVKKAESPHPDKCFEIDEFNNPKLTELLRKNVQSPEQGLRSLYAPDGAYYLVSNRFLTENRAFVNESSVCMIRKGQRVVNIDSETDFLFAEFLFSSNLITP